MQNPEDIRTESDYLWSAEYLRNATPHHDIICDFLQWKLKGMVLDIGERNPLTERLEGRNGIPITSTIGNLDTQEWLSNETRMKDAIVCSHVIEHLFNPLLFLNCCKAMLNTDGTLYVITPIKPYWITPAKCHFHEMDFRNFKRLVHEAGFGIVDWYEYSVPIPFRFSLRNWLRRLYKEYSIVTLKKA